jgi:hypothetical protein
MPADGRTRVRRLAALAALPLVAGLLVGCGSDGPVVPTPTGIALPDVELSDPDRNGVEYLDGPTALDAVLRSVRTATSVTMAGTFTELLEAPQGSDERPEGRTLSVTFVGTAADYSARVEVDDGTAVQTTDVRTSGATSEVTTTAASCVSSADDAVTRFAPLLSPPTLLSTLLRTGDAALTVSTGAVVEGAPGEPATVELVVGDDSSVVGTLVVSAEGEPRPLSFTAADPSGRGVFTFSRWDERASLPDLGC